MKLHEIMVLLSATTMLHTSAKSWQQ